MIVMAGLALFLVLVFAYSIYGIYKWVGRGERPRLGWLGHPNKLGMRPRHARPPHVSHALHPP